MRKRANSAERSGFFDILCSSRAQSLVDELVVGVAVRMASNWNRIPFFCCVAESGELELKGCP